MGTGVTAVTAAAVIDVVVSVGAGFLVVVVVVVVAGLSPRLSASWQTRYCFCVSLRRLALGIAGRDGISTSSGRRGRRRDPFRKDPSLSFSICRASNGFDDDSATGVEQVAMGVSMFELFLDFFWVLDPLVLLMSIRGILFVVIVVVAVVAAVVEVLSPKYQA